MIICVKTIMYIEESKSQSSRGTSGTFKTNFFIYIKNEFLIVFKYYIKKKKKKTLLFDVYEFRITDRINNYFDRNRRITLFNKSCDAITWGRRKNVNDQ